jgi:transposase-like protein
MAGANEPRKRRHYTAEDRAKVVASAKEVGVVAAGRQHRVPQTTVSTWIRRDGATSTSAEAPSAKRQSASSAKKAVAAPSTVADAPPAKRSASSAEKAGAAPSSTPGTIAARARPARRYTPSEKAKVLEYAAAHGVSAAKEEFGVSRFAIYEWQRKLAKAAKGEGPSPTSGPAPSEIEAQRDREILGEWRKHPGLGPSQIKNQLRRRGIKVSVVTTRRVMEEQGYGCRCHRPSNARATMSRTSR